MISAEPSRDHASAEASAAETRPASPTRSSAKDWLRALELTQTIERNPARLLPTVIDELAERLGEAPALLSDAEQLSFRGLAERSRRYALWALDQGLRAGDVVCLIMPNRPEYMAVWLGLTRVGVVVALINTHLRGPSLAHGLRVAGARHIIVDARLLGGLNEALDALDAPPRVWVHGGGEAPDSQRIDLAADAFAADAVDAVQGPAVRLSDRALLIFTSGTTGLPKAANVSHHRLMMWSHWFAGLMDVQSSDRLYNCLPMYHSVGGVVATGAVLVGGGSVVIAEKFSARRFWDEVSRWNCTLVQYIGELCRYLMAAPPYPAEARHALRLFCGNGLASDVWEAFQARFAVPRILEFYAATEGAFSLFNLEGKPGAVGRIPSFLAHRFPAAIVRFDPELGAPARNEAGFCMRCASGEVGEAIGRISAGAASGRFEGYTDASESERKVLRDVFEPGDAWLRTGDLMRTDDQGFYYFVDRVGDTFRWKGENVATTEVAQALCAYPGVSAASVYGVKVAGAEGRAGMAAIVADPALDLAGLRAHLTARLPEFARPLFLRLVSGLEITETFKPKKQGLVDAGYDPSRSEDRLFFDDRSTQSYVVLDPALFQHIEAGTIRL